jgi:hypothetical protein
MHKKSPPENGWDTCVHYIIKWLENQYEFGKVLTMQNNNELLQQIQDDINAVRGYL